MRKCQFHAKRSTTYSNRRRAILYANSKKGHCIFKFSKDHPIFKSLGAPLYIQSSRGSSQHIIPRRKIHIQTNELYY